MLISSRQALVESVHWQGHQKLDLQTLAVTDGVKLLQNLGCHGSLASLQTASREMSGHALALVLMGRLLKKRFLGQIESRDQLPSLFEDEKGHTLRVLRYYDKIYWSDAHFVKRIYQKLFGGTPHQPDTLEELEPLYRAVVHGCLAGKYQKALNNVYCMTFGYL